MNNCCKNKNAILIKHSKRDGVIMKMSNHMVSDTCEDVADDGGDGELGT